MEVAREEVDKVKTVTGSALRKQNQGWLVVSSIKTRWNQKPGEESRKKDKEEIMKKIEEIVETNKEQTNIQYMKK